MADITMCLGLNCMKKEKCYRHKANPSQHQSYFLVIDPKDCEYFIQIKKEYRNNEA